MKNYRIIKDNSLGKYLVQRKQSFLGVIRYKTIKIKGNKDTAINYLLTLKNGDNYFNKKRKVLDEPETTIFELFQHIFVNFLYGLSGGFVIAFVTLFVTSTSILNGLLLFMFYFLNKQFESKVLNRNKYVTKLGKNYIFPIPSTVGFVLGAYLSTLI